MRGKDKSLLISLIFLVVGMCALAYASVPLYRLFCAATGLGGTTQRVEAKSNKTIDREMTITFNADTDPALPWKFYPKQSQVKVKVGENILVYYIAENLSESETVGQSTYNVTPNDAGLYFHKIECFCFEQQKLAGKEKVEMPLSFYIDPEIAKNKTLDELKTITLSYTFFKVKK